MKTTTNRFSALNLLIGLSALFLSLPSTAAQDVVASDVKVTVLSSNLANGAAVGEWGLSALVEVDGNCILFDAGRYPDTVIRNAAVLNVDLSCVTDVVFSHFHFDHTTGLLPLLDNLREINPEAIQRIHVADGFFSSRRRANSGSDAESNQMIALRDSIEAQGVEFLIHAEATEIFPAVWVSGPVERRHPEQNYSANLNVAMDGEWVRDFVPESQALVVRTDEGPIVLLGCGHSGVVNALDHIQDTIQDEAVHALMGGLHLFAADDETLDWTAARLLEIGVENLMAGHCTGIEPLMRLRAGLNLDRSTAVVGAVGSSFVLGEGIHPTVIAM
ncbi:MAG: MBL fold metallo-hydrolase [SAR86 cluster bacterium]|uniref:MBL fold metallo-hydrolase n=1 Tax=SAR86 cluster bacterium TaxID=2030880 RepID=A0A2A4WYH3_9GAMM|nr:MAG: MBL fold metallo-hydrolase [SAR86 cluster bacterium]